MRGSMDCSGTDEEETTIAPAVAAARARGIDIVGPLSPDAAFLPVRRQQTDLYICMYHDQGLIPLKALAFDVAVNVTLGLPIVRTSVDHGTAFDIAWQGRAEITSLIEAVRWAARAVARQGDENARMFGLCDLSWRVSLCLCSVRTRMTYVWS